MLIYDFIDKFIQLADIYPACFVGWKTSDLKLVFFSLFFFQLNEVLHKHFRFNYRLITELASKRSVLVWLYSFFNQTRKY